jgi:hypothetical protein
MLLEVEQVLADALAQAPGPVAEPRLPAALVIAAYRAVLTEAAGRLLSGAPLPAVAAGHQRRLNQAFGMLEPRPRAADRETREGAAGRPAHWRPEIFSDPSRLLAVRQAARDSLAR